MQSLIILYICFHQYFLVTLYIEKFYNLM